MACLKFDMNSQNAVVTEFNRHCLSKIMTKIHFRMV